MLCQDFEDALLALRELLQTPDVSKLLTAPMGQIKEWTGRDLELVMMQRTDAILAAISKADKTATKLHDLHAVHSKQ